MATHGRPFADNDVFKRGTLSQHAAAQSCIPRGTGWHTGDKCFVTSLNARQQRMSLTPSDQCSQNRELQHK